MKRYQCKYVENIPKSKFEIEYLEWYVKTKKYRLYQKRVY